MPPRAIAIAAAAISIVAGAALLSPAAAPGFATPPRAAAPGLAAGPLDSLPPASLRAPTESGPCFAIVAFDSASSSWGAACAAAEIASGARLLSARAGAGAIASLGPGPAPLDPGMAALAAGAAADSALQLLRLALDDPAARQILVLGRDGRVAGDSGVRLPGFSGVLLRGEIGCAGFGLHGEETLSAMAAAFEASQGGLAARLVAALEAADRAEGEPFRRRRRDASAAVLVVRAGAEPWSGSDRMVDLRVDGGGRGDGGDGRADEEEDPVAALAELVARHAETFLPAAHVRFGDMARRAGDDRGAAREYAAAEAGFRGAVASAPKDPDALNELAWFLATRGGDPAEALRFAEAAVLARGDDPNLLDTLAEAAYRAGNLERAIEAAERAARLARGNARYADRLRVFRAARAALVPTR
jgi:uncharacterized Ntn-hydrolase superfamily protein